MWIIRAALDRPHTFLVLALAILLISPIVIQRTPTDIFPNIDIPVIAIDWQYAGLNPEEIEGRITTPFERGLTTLVDDIEHIESTTINGYAIVKVFLQPGASTDKANAQIGAISQNVVKRLPPGITPPLVINYNAATVPILQIGLSGEGLTETELNDLGLNFVRIRLITVPGAAVPYPYGGRQRQVRVNLNAGWMQAKGVSAADVVSALAQQNLVLPSGTAKIGDLEYSIGLNASAQSIEELNNLPVRVANGTPILMRDVAHVADGFAPQTNAVRQDGRRGSLMTVLKSGNASTISVVEGIRKMLPVVAETLPPQLRMQPFADQSVFVQAAIDSVVHEGVIAAALTGLMILLFLGSWRSTLIIAISIPLSVLSSVIVLGFLGETINIMTLGGLALAVGILVDDATVTIENIERFLEEGHNLRESILQGAAQISVPALVSTLCICIVFLPMFFLGGVAGQLFVPLAMAVIFAMLASYILSRTLVPTLAMFLLKAKGRPEAGSLNPFTLFHRTFEAGFEAVRAAYRDALELLIRVRWVYVPLALLVCSSAVLLNPWLGQDFFPTSDAGQFTLHVRARTGTRIEETARLCDLVEGSIRRVVPPEEIEGIVDNIGIPYSSINLTYNSSGIIGPADADIIVSLKPDHRPTEDYVRELRKVLPREFPSATFYFLPGDMVTQILNFGTPAPINVQIEGKSIEENRVVANEILADLRHVPGLVDARMHQRFDYPKLRVDVDRVKALQAGLTQFDIATSMLVALSGSYQTAPSYYLNPVNGVNYNLVTQAPQYEMDSLDSLRNIPVGAPQQSHQEVLAGYANIHRGAEMAVVTHYNIRRTLNLYASVQDRDLAAVGRDVESIVEKHRASLPRGSTISVMGQLATMRESYAGLAAGLLGAIVLVYLLIVVNFQSWLDPFIIVMALPAALAGIELGLFLTDTRLSVPALMGAIMCMGVATANSILVVSFAKERLQEHGDAIRAAAEAGYTRFRPVLMTALAMLIGMIPMALGAGEGGEQNAPLGRAVIGGLACATVATLLFVPAVFALLHGRQRAKPATAGEEEVA
ncbi:MAG: MMPL family transporter [Acidobacteria bacterium]|nr:MMPL family transporter [Acidobacteriota bacterium]